jgi:hypothetical protein
MAAGTCFLQVPYLIFHGSRSRFDCNHKREITDEQDVLILLFQFIKPGEVHQRSVPVNRIFGHLLKETSAGFIVFTYSRAFYKIGVGEREMVTAVKQGIVFNEMDRYVSVPPLPDAFHERIAGIEGNIDRIRIFRLNVKGMNNRQMLHSFLKILLEPCGKSDYRTVIGVVPEQFSEFQTEGRFSVHNRQAMDGR